MHGESFTALRYYFNIVTIDPYKIGDGKYCRQKVFTYPYSSLHLPNGCSNTPIVFLIPFKIYRPTRMQTQSIVINDQMSECDIWFDAMAIE